MTSRFALADYRVRLWLGVILPALMLALLFAHRATVHAQSSDQLTVYSPQTTYSVAMLDIQGHPYIGLIELLEPLGSVEGKPDGKKYKLRFTPPGGHPVEAQFNEGKDKSKILGENFKLPANFAQQNGRGYVPLSSVPEILTKLLAKPVQLHPSARRLFIGDIPMRFSMSLDKSSPPKLIVSFSAPVNPTIANEPGRTRFTFRREPVVSNGQDSVNFSESTITGAVFAEHDGLAELDEFEDLFYAGARLFFGDVVFVEAEGYVVLDGEGVEEGGLLKDHSYAGAEFEEVGLGHGGDLFAEDTDGAGVGLEEAVGELHEDGFAAAGGAEDDSGLGAMDVEGDVFEDDLAVEGDGDVFERDYGGVGGGGFRFGLEEGLRHGFALASEDADHQAGD